MKRDLHPEFHDVIFKDISCDFSILTKSTMKVDSGNKVTWEDGKEYPLVKLDISSQSHPFYTGQQRLVDAEGRAEKFRKKYGKK